jgi:hypothetical protein
VSRAGRLIPGERAGSYQRTRVADIGPGSDRTSSQRFYPRAGLLGSLLLARAGRVRSHTLRALGVATHEARWVFLPFPP